MWLKELKFLSIWLKELNLSCFPVWLKELNFSFDIDSKKWTFFEYDSKNWIFLNMTQKNRTFLFLEYDSKNWLFFNMIQRIEFLMTHKIEPPFWRRLKESNPFFWTQHQKLNFCLKIQKATFFFFEKLEKIKPFSEKYDSKNWFFLFFFFFSKNDSNIWIFSYDSKNWTSCYEPLFNMTQRDEVLFFSFWLKELKPFVFLKMSQRIEPLFHMSYFFTRLKELTFFNMTQRFFQIDSKELNSLFSMTQRNDLVSPKWRTELNPYFERDAKNGTLFSLNTTQRIEPFFLWMRRRDLNPFFFEYDAENWILSLWIWRKELKALFKMTRRIEPRKLLKDLNLLFWTWLKESNPFFWMWLKIWKFLAEK